MTEEQRDSLLIEMSENIKLENILPKIEYPTIVYDIV